MMLGSAGRTAGIPSTSGRVAPHASATLSSRLRSGHRSYLQQPRMPSEKPLLTIARASEEPGQSDEPDLQKKFFKQPGSQRPSDPQQDAAGNILDKVAPYALGRQARAAFDDLWSNVARLSSPTRSFVIDEVMEPGQDADFEAPQASYTTVLIVGASGRVGRIVTRKLLLRGYAVKALVRKREGLERAVALPTAVEVIQGDIGEMAVCQEAVKGVNKVIFCAAARSTLTADLLRVDDRGVMNLAKALQDENNRLSKSQRLKYNPRAKKEIADFSSTYHQARWDVTYVGSPADESDKGSSFRDAYVNSATAEISEEDNLVFEGILMARGAIAEVGARISSKLPGGDHRMAHTEGLALRVRGDGHFYLCIVETVGGARYGARFPTRPGYLTVRLPYAAFRSEFQGQPPLDSDKVSGMSIRYENKRMPGVTAARAARVGKVDDTKPDQQFCLEVDWIKALPSGTEPDVVLVSCAGRSRPGVSAQELEKIISFKRRGEENLRLSGLGYAIIRPGTLVEEPGGYRGLVFDQGDRITQPISAADVADICLRALHEPEARNKTFDVAYESDHDKGTSMFELVAHVPDKSNNYLRAAVEPLAKNT